MALRNGGTDCFLNATVQLLRFAPRAKQCIIDYRGNNGLMRGLKGLIQSEGRPGLFDLTALRSLLVPRDRSDRRTNMSRGHQDPTEFLESYLFRDADPRSESAEQQFYNLFAFTAITELTCLNEACPILGIAFDG